MESERLFLARCQRLAILSASFERADMLDIAAILRQLFVDRHSLVDQVNANSLKLTFAVGAWPPLLINVPPPTLIVLHDVLDPSNMSFPSRPIFHLNRSEFYSYPLAYYETEPITVKHVIRYAANVLGGVHIDPSPSKKYALIHALSKRYGSGGLPLGVLQLKVVARMALTALAPLIEDVKARLGVENDPKR